MKLISPDAIDRSPAPPSAEQDFETVLLSRTPTDDGELADLIEQDGRWRLDRGLPCGLDRYRKAVPDLAAHPIALDAAIDIGLRDLARRDGCQAPRERHAETLLRSYPEFAGPIRLAALLGHQLTSTMGLSSAAPSAARPAVPRWVGGKLESGRRRYELTKMLGRGSSGTVCEAIDHLLSDASHQARVAVKIVSVNAENLQRQASEATKARRIEHAGVVRVLDRGLTDAGQLYLVYELITGGDLQAWFENRGKRLELREAVGLASAIASGVHAAHAAGLVHCDLKPSNVLMTPVGQPRVSDFGVAVAAPGHSKPAPGDPADRVPFGNLAFAAPEQIRQSGSSASPLVDVYALGGLLYFLTTGKLPNGSSAQEVLQTHDPVSGRKAPPSILAARPDADWRLDRICARALEPRPDKRYGSAVELAQDLDAWLARRPIAWMSESRFQRVRLWARRSPGFAAVSAACLLVITGVAVGVSWQEYARWQSRKNIRAKFYMLKEMRDRGEILPDEKAVAIFNDIDPKLRLTLPAKEKAVPANATSSEPKPPTKATEATKK